MPSENAPAALAVGPNMHSIAAANASADNSPGHRRLGDRVEFPIEVFPKNVRRLVEQVAVSTGSPIDFPAVAVLTTAGAAIGGSRRIKINESYDEPANLFCVMVADPGTGKSPAAKFVVKPLVAAQEAALASHREAYGSIDKSPRLVTTDTSLYGLVKLLANNPRGILANPDEMAGLMQRINAHGGEREQYLQLFNNQPIFLDRGNRKSVLHVPMPVVSLMGTIQPDKLRVISSATRANDGFVQRFLFSMPAVQGMAGAPRNPVPHECQDAWAACIRNLWKLDMIRGEGGPKAIRVGMHERARQCLYNYHDKLAAEANSDDATSDLAALYAKMKIYSGRFALNLALLNWAARADRGDAGPSAVNLRAVEGAIALCDYFASHWQAVVRRMTLGKEDQRVEQLIAWMTRRQITRCDVRDIQRAEVAGIRTASEANRLFDQAVDRGFGYRDNGAEGQRSPGRPGQYSAFILGRRNVIAFDPLLPNVLNSMTVVA